MRDRDPSRSAVVLLVVAGLIVLGAVLVAAAAHPAVSAFELQRRDRLTPAARFIPFAYQFLLNRAPDAQGLATYQQVYDDAGPEAVALAIARSAEFQRTRTADAAAPADIASQVVAAYAAAQADQRFANDTPGRIGFVVVILACLLGLRWLHRAAATGHTSEDSRLYLPARYVIALFAALAVMAWVSSDLLLGSFGRSSRFVYIEWLSQVAAAATTRGVDNVWTPYPQGAQALIVGLSQIATSLGSAFGSDIWTAFSIFRVLFQLVFLLLPSILTVAVVAAIGRHISPRTATLAALGAAFSIAPIYYGFLAAYVTDPLPVLLAVVAIWCLAERRPTLAGLAIGAGAVLKLFPLVLLPVALVHADSARDRLRILAASLGVLLLVFVPPALANFDVFMSPLRWQTGRPPWESWYAFVNWTISAPHEFQAAYLQDSSVGDGFGWVFWGITPRISALLAPVPPAPARWETTVSLIGSAATLALCLGARSRSILGLVRWALFALASFMFWGIGWSPQYELFVIPFVLLGVRPAGAGLAAALALEGLTLLEYPVLLPWAYFYGGSVVWIMWAVLLGRYLLLAWLCAYVVRTEFAGGALLARVRSVGRSVRAPVRRAPHAVAPLLVLVCLVGPPMVVAAQVAQPDAPCGPVSQRFSGLELSAAPATMEDWPLLNGHFFGQAGGYAIVDDEVAAFWSEYRRLGGWTVLGFPATRRFTWHGSLSQGTQRAILQSSPVTREVQFANVLDLLHEQGFDDTLFEQQQIPPPLEVDEAGLPYETIAARRLAWLDDRPAIKQKYCNAPGGADPLLLWGLPTSRPVNVGNPGSVYVLRTQRAAFQEWVDGAPWAPPGGVTVVLAGDLAKDFKLFPVDAMMPEENQIRPPE